MRRHSTWLATLLIGLVCTLGCAQLSAAGQFPKAPSTAWARSAAPGGDRLNQFTGRLSDLRADVRSNVIKQLALLTGSDETTTAGFGYSVAISGNVIVVGSPWATVGGNTWQGEAYVFVKPATGWANMTQTAILTASDGAAWSEFGTSVGISGNTIVVGSYGSGASNAAAYVFVEPPTGWAGMTETAELTATRGILPVVGISGDVVVAWDPSNDGVEVFVEPAAGWTNMSPTAELTSSDGNPIGNSVTISGNTIVASAPAATVGSNPYQGALYLFVRPATGWANMTQTAILSASDGESEDYLGASSNGVSISGNTVLAGAPQHAVNGNFWQGAAYLFVRPSGGWTNMTETAEFTAPDGGPVNLFGWSVFTSPGVAIVGAYWGGGDYQGAAYVYVKPAGGWATTSQSTIELVGPGFASGFGASVGMSGNILVVGADNPSDNGDDFFNAGYVFGPGR